MATLARIATVASPLTVTLLPCYTQEFPPLAVSDFMSVLTWSVVVFTTAAYHLAGRGRGSACSNVKSSAALKPNRLVRCLVGGDVYSGATG